MFGERHDLPHEFPAQMELIEKLIGEDEEFDRLYSEYDAIDQEVLKIEQNVEPVSDTYAEELKMKRVHLKDRLYQIMREHVSD